MKGGGRERLFIIYPLHNPAALFTAKRVKPVHFLLIIVFPFFEMRGPGSMKRSRACLLCLVMCVFGWVSFAATATASTSCPDCKADLAWPEFDGQGSQIFFAAYRNGGWGVKLQLTNNQYSNMHPDLTLDGDGNLWLVWTALDGVRNKIFYSVQRGGEWSSPEEIETGLESSIRPTIAVDALGHPWITWAGYNGIADDVYVCRWDGIAWTDPVQVNPENMVPDILPEPLLNSDDELEVTWQGFDGAGYSAYRSVYSQGKWSLPQAAQVVDEQVVLSKKEKFGAKGLQLPDFFKPLKDDDRLYQLMIR